MGMPPREPSPAITFNKAPFDLPCLCQNQEQKTVDFGLTKEQKLLVERVDRLVKERIAPRAAQYDIALQAPAEDVQDLHRKGWLLANLERKRGGLGYGLYGDDPLAFFLLDEQLA
jgi:alkylation response protein AidB-like acyl-CoA dehydrogenase